MNTKELAGVLVSMVVAGAMQPVVAQRSVDDSVKELARQIAAQASPGQKRRVAVLPFRELHGQATAPSAMEGRTSALGNHVADVLLTYLVKAGGFDVVERRMLDQVMEEMKLGQTGAIDPDTEKRLGKLAGADAIVTGTFTDLRSFVELRCRMIDVETGIARWAATERIAKDADVLNMLGTPVQPAAKPMEPKAPEPKVVPTIPGREAGPKSPVGGREMVRIAKGTFYTGSPKDEAGRNSNEAVQHPAEMDHDFWMDATEVTNAAFQRFVRAQPEWQKDRAPVETVEGRYLENWTGIDYPRDRAQHPVVFVTWFAARAYCAWAGKRLPTEAEWEYAARAGARTAFWWGDTFDATKANWNRRSTEPVGQPNHTNPWGLSDMLGNVFEWTSSLYFGTEYRADREDPNADGPRSALGGSYDSEAPKWLRSAYRWGRDPRTCIGLVGFRCAR
jgi:formylglycine-generating enzyme required for sulfatase activity